VSDRAPRPLAFPTAPNMMMGTPRYVSPEVACGRPADARSDLYSAGLVLYLMLSGRGPFDHLQGEAKLVCAHVASPPLPPSRYAPEPVPPELDQALLKVLSKQPDDRFQTAEEFERVLQEVATMLPRPAGWLVTTLFESPDRASPESDPSDDAETVAKEPLVSLEPSAMPMMPPTEGDDAPCGSHPWRALARIGAVFLVALVSAAIGTGLVTAVLSVLGAD
jgi:serine/threonine protein kinase